MDSFLPEYIYFFQFWPSLETGVTGAQSWTKKSNFCVCPVFVKISFFQNVLHGICAAIRATCGHNLCIHKKCIKSDLVSLSYWPKPALCFKRKIGPTGSSTKKK